MRLMRIIIVVMICLTITNLYANDLGVMGETYPIVEVDFMDFIQSRIQMMNQNDQWKQLQNRVQNDAMRYRDRPKKVDGISRAVETRNWQFDPSIVLQHDVTLPDGKLIALAGTRINPFDYISLSKILIFYNGDDTDQVNWVLEQTKKLNKRIKLILVNGSVLTQEKKIKQPIYFDQAGKITSRFGITHVPATVSQEGTILRITEVKI